MTEPKSFRETELDKRFQHHPPKNDDVVGAHERVRAGAWFLADLIYSETVSSREQSLAITYVEEAMMWANAAVARHQ